MPKPDPALKLDLSKYEGVYERLGARYEVEAEGRKLYLTFVLNPMHAQVLGKPERIKYELLPIDETHFILSLHERGIVAMNRGRKIIK